MAVSTLQSNAIGIVPVGTFSGGLGTVPMLYGYEGGSTQNWIAGAVLIRSSGYLIEASADPTADIVGIAAGPASGTQGTLVPFYPISQNIIWEATFEDQTNEDHALVIANMYTDYGLQTDTPGHWYIDENETTNTSVMIIAPRDWDDVVNAKVRARVKFVFLSDVLARQT